VQFHQVEMTLEITEAIPYFQMLFLVVAVVGLAVAVALVVLLVAVVMDFLEEVQLVQERHLPEPVVGAAQEV